jgi:hypothetical protein
VGARSEQRNTRVNGEGRLQEEQTENESGRESGKVRGTNGRKERVQDTVWERERERKYFRKNGYASVEVERMRAEGRRMSVELSERDKARTSKREGRQSENPGTTGSMRDA